MLNYPYFNNLSDLHLKHQPTYAFSFSSLISPNFIKNFTFFFTTYKNSKKIQLKQSYILLTWFYYLSIIEKDITKEKNISFFVLPLKKKISTHVKAPIAHKNWSKEQFLYQFYLLKISFRTNFFNKIKPSSVNAGLLFVLLSKKFFPAFETNIFFLKNYKILFSFFDRNYFNYYRL